MANWRFVTPGYDPTSSGSAPTNSQLLQMWTQGIPATISAGSGGGFIVWSATAPDVVTYPDLARCIWGDISGTNAIGEFYYYDGSAWQPWKINPGTLDGDSFADDSIAVTKLENGTNSTILFTNASGDIVWANLATVIPNNSITAAQLSNAGGADYILYSGGGGVWAAATYASKFNTAIAAATIYLTQLENSDAGGLDNQVLHVTESGSGAGVSTNYIETLLRDNQILRTKLAWSTATATIAAGVTAIDGTVAPAYTLALNANITDFSVSLSSGQSVTLLITQSASYTIDFTGSGIKWKSGSAPVITTGAGKVDVATFINLNGVIYGSIIQDMY